LASGLLEPFSQGQSPGHDVSVGVRREVTPLRDLKNRTDHLKVEVVAELGLEQARAVEVEGGDEDGVVEQDGVAEDAREFRALASCAAGKDAEGRVHRKIGPVVRALEAPAWPFDKAGASTDVGGKMAGLSRLQVEGVCRMENGPGRAIATTGQFFRTEPKRRDVLRGNWPKVRVRTWLKRRRAAGSRGVGMREQPGKA
jgi:hypothetical protein